MLLDGLRVHCCGTGGVKAVGAGGEPPVASTERLPMRLCHRFGAVTAEHAPRVRVRSRDGPFRTTPSPLP